MPDMDGVETARRIRSEVGPDIPVIILTAYDWAEIEGEAREAGVTAFLAKPFYRSKVCYLLSELSEDREGTEPVRPGWKADYRDKGFCWQRIMKSTGKSPGSLWEKAALSLRRPVTERKRSGWCGNQKRLL